MRIAWPTVAGIVMGLGGQGLATGVTLAVAIAAGGGPDADLDAGERFGVLFFCIFAYGIAQVAVLASGVAVSLLIGRRAWLGLVLGCGLGLIASLFYMCGGFGV